MTHIRMVQNVHDTGSSICRHVVTSASRGSGLIISNRGATLADARLVTTTTRRSISNDLQKGEMPDETTEIKFIGVPTHNPNPSFESIPELLGMTSFVQLKVVRS